MGVQKEILVRQMDGSEVDSVKYDGTDDGKKVLQGGVGVLAIGKPGHIVARAFGPNVYALSFKEDQHFGTAVELPDGSYGVLVNSDDVAFSTGDNSFGWSDTLIAGQVGEVMTYGICVIKYDALEDIQSKMNCRVLYKDATSCEVELTGSKVSGGDASDSDSSEG